MKIRVLMFAGLRERVGAAEVVLDDLCEGATVRDVLERLGGRWPLLSRYSLALAVNCEVVGEEAILSEGDEVALLPPVSGG